jgi:hypothetical protein
MICRFYYPNKGKEHNRMTESISPIALVEYDKDEREWSIRIRPRFVFIAPSINEGMYTLTAVATNGTYTVEVPLRQAQHNSVVQRGQYSYKDVRLSKGMRISGKTTTHSHVFMRDIVGRFSSVEADVEVVIQDYTKVYIVDEPLSMRGTYL